MRTRRYVVLGLALAVQGWLLAAAGRAQQFAGRGPVTRPASPYTSSPATSAEPDLLTPYASRSARSIPYGSAASNPPRYSRAPVAKRPPVPLPDKTSRGAVFARGVGDYYPMMRSGQAPNRNVIDPRSLCVPGRRALLQR